MKRVKIKILFIINPISGGHNKAKIIQDIPGLLDNNRFDIFISHTKHCGHAAQLAKNAVEKMIDIVVAVGGDGTINEIASQLVNTQTALAIVPCGSGNGLARDLKISLHYKKAIKLINSLKIKKIDVGVCNNQYFFSLTGVGFDAKVAYDFNRGKKRKFVGYAWAILKDYFNMNNQPYEIKIDDETLSDTFFFITIANCSQWGYNVNVVPSASLDDNLFSINLCKKPNLLSLFPFVLRLLFGKISTSKYCTIKTAQNITIQAKQNFYYHIDGDSKGVTNIIDTRILHKTLLVLTK